jgi:hypothetical protein
MLGQGTFGPMAEQARPRLAAAAPAISFSGKNGSRTMRSPACASAARLRQPRDHDGKFGLEE